FEAIPAEYL
nr:Chain B, THROMBIN NONAPEPTIDE INHIBITOR [synthetic construct]